MNNDFGLKSLASDKRDYVAVQIREDGVSRIHLQGAGAKVNRDYGVSVMFTAPPKLVSWLTDECHTELSLAGTGRAYVYAQVALRNGECHFQVEGDEELNRDYGAAFNITNENLAKFITKTLACKSEETFDAKLV